MGRITSIARVSGVRGATMVSIEIDETGWIDCHDVIVHEFDLVRGAELDAAARQAIELRALELAALDVVQRAINQRPLSEHQVRTRLAAERFPEQAIDAALARARGLGLVDDEQLAEQYVRSRIERGHGVRRIRSDLMRRGITADVINGVLATQADGDAMQDRCVAVLGRRFDAGRLAEPRQVARAERFLLGRGYTYDEIRRAISTVRAGEAPAAPH